MYFEYFELLMDLHYRLKQLSEALQTFADHKFLDFYFVFLSATSFNVSEICVCIFIGKYFST